MALKKTKALQANRLEGLHPAYLALYVVFLSVAAVVTAPQRQNPIVKAGLLAPGSSYLPTLPAGGFPAVDVSGFVPGYSGGTAPELHGISY
jgi:hypothetical protein